MIRLIDLLKEAEELKISEREFNSKAQQFYNKLSESDVIALRSWTANLDTPPKGLISRKKAKKYLITSPNIKGVSQEFIKKLSDNKPFLVFRAYDPETSGTGLKSYTLRKGTSDAFNYYDIKSIDVRTITYKDVIAVPAISFKGWEDAGGYLTEYEIVLSI